MKKLAFNKRARRKLLKGAEIMYKAVATTFSPLGRNVAIARPWGNPLIVHDGFMVSSEIEVPDEFVQMGIQMIQEAARKTNQEAGDATTSVTILSYHLIKEGMKLLENGKNPMKIRKELYQVLPKIVDNLQKMSTPIKDNEEVKRVATISAADETIGSLVAQAIEKVGRDGQITVEEGNISESRVEYTEGMTFNKGYSHPYLITNPNRMEAVIDKPQVVVIGKKITTQIEAIPLVETLMHYGKNILLIGDIGGDALNILVNNKMKGNVNILVVDAPGYNDNRKTNLEDIAALTGATVVSDELGLQPQQFAQQFDRKWIGEADSVVSNKKSTVIIPTKKSKPSLEARIAQIRSLLEKEESPFEREHLEERLARLTTGIAVIKVGSKTDIEMRERVERVKDAIGAARSVIDEGWVPGGSTTFLKLAGVIDTEPSDGARILEKALRAPIQKLLYNAGMTKTEISEVVNKIEVDQANLGYEVETGSMTNLVDKGIIDPSKVIRLSIENAVSVASSILTTDALIAIKLVKAPYEND